MNRSVSVGVVVFVVTFAALLGVPATMAQPDTGGSEPTQGQYSTGETPSETRSQLRVASLEALDQSQDFDQTTFEITVHENGSATWTFRHEWHFDGENKSEERRAFEEFAERFESEETDLYDRFTNQSQALTESGAERTGREMEATNFRRSAYIDEQLSSRGIVEMSFTWKGFARVEGGTVEAGDIFENLYIAEDQAIEIEAGDGLTFQHVEPESEARYRGDSLEEADSVRWRGEQQFLDGQPRAVLVQEGAEGLATWHLAAGALFALAVVGAAAVWYRRQEDTDDAGGVVPDVTAQAGETASASASSERDGDGPPPSPSDADASPGAETESESASESDPVSEPLPDEELLTDEDRVVKLIRENGGRMKQVNIVEETGWSKSKVSMLLSDMEDEGTISKLRVGRENIISLEGFEPEATKSPFEE